MSRVIRVSILIGTFLIVTAAFLAHKPETALAQQSMAVRPVPLCTYCIDLSTTSYEELQSLRDACDNRANNAGYNVGILRPQNPADFNPAACAVGTACTIAENLWICLGI